MNIVLKLALTYLEKHPEVIEQLIEQLFAAVVNALATHNVQSERKA